MQIGRLFDRDPHPQSVFDREDGKRNKLDGNEQGGVLSLEFRYQFQCDRDKIDHDEKDD